MTESNSQAIKEAKERWLKETVKGQWTPFNEGHELQADILYTPADIDLDYQRDLGLPGEYPYTRGIYPEMYRKSLWVMRQIAGYGTPEETNKRFRYLLDQGETGLTVVFDQATVMGLDSDDPEAEGEVGKNGVPIDTIEDMRILFQNMPIDQVHAGDRQSYFNKYHY